MEGKYKIHDCHDKHYLGEFYVYRITKTQTDITRNNEQGKDRGSKVVK